MLSDPSFWVFLATVIFALVMVKYAREPLFKLLDERSDKIRRELDEAEKLRVEAQTMLAEYQRKHRDAMQTADEIIAHAKEQAERIRTDSIDALEAALERREAQLLDRINRAELAALQEVREQAADISAAAARQLVVEALSKDSDSLVDKTIKDLPKRLN